MTSTISRAKKAGIEAIRGSIPDWFAQPAWGLLRTATIRASDLQEFERKLAAIPKRRPVHILLEGAAVLRKTMSFPGAARSQLLKAAGMELRQSLPNSGNDLRWTLRDLSRKGKKTEVEALLVRGSLLDEILKTADQSGHRIAVIEPAGNTGSVALVDNRRTTQRASRIWLRLAVAGAALMGSYIAYEVGDQINAGQAAIAAKIEQRDLLEKRALKLKQDASGQKDTNAGLIRKLNAIEFERSLLTVLLELTRVLEDSVWVSDLTLAGSVLRFSAFTEGEPTDVLVALSRQNWTEDVRVDGAVSFDSISRKNRVNVTITLARDPVVSR